MDSSNLDTLESEYLRKRVAHLENELKRAGKVVEQAYKWASVYINQEDNLEIYSEKLLSEIDIYNSESSNSLRKAIGLPIPIISPRALAESLVSEWASNGKIHEFMKLTEEEYAFYNSDNVLPDDFVSRHFGDIFDVNPA